MNSDYSGIAVSALKSQNTDAFQSLKTSFLLPIMISFTRKLCSDAKILAQGDDSISSYVMQISDLVDFAAFDQ